MASISARPGLQTPGPIWHLWRKTASCFRQALPPTSPMDGRAQAGTRSSVRLNWPERPASSRICRRATTPFCPRAGRTSPGGQRQRLAIARALLTHAPFLILDEPTSALDPHHERLLVETLQALKGRRTIVLVTHRLESVVACDQIFVMDAGQIVERGTHRELLDQNSHYARNVVGIARRTLGQRKKVGLAEQRAVLGQG